LPNVSAQAIASCTCEFCLYVCVSVCLSQGFATVSLASYGGDTVLRQWYNILSYRFMKLENTTESNTVGHGKQVCFCVSCNTGVNEEWC